jgi:hypothetical protein
MVDGYYTVPHFFSHDREFYVYILMLRGYMIGLMTYAGMIIHDYLY